MPWIQNVSYSDIIKGFHDCDDNTILISIVDPMMKPPIPIKKFHSVHYFEFFDYEKDHDSGMKINVNQAKELVDILKNALYNEQNVVVHCVAGLCRSGAVCGVGVIMGFQDRGRFRTPNLLVKSLMLRDLGLTYD